jgi:tetratricopeptide (TPR) repeat protein
MSTALRDKVVTIFAALFEVLVLATKEIRRGRVKSYFKSLIRSDSPVQEALERLRSLTLGEERQVLADTYGGVAQINTKTDRVEALVSQVSQNVQELRTEYRERTTAAHQNKLREILEPSPFPEDYYSSFEKYRVPKTGDWLLEDSGLQSWLRGETQYLWMSGGLGSGKSFLVTRLISWGSENLSHLAYFYFRANDPETRSVLQALRDVAYQLSESDAYYGRQLIRRIHNSDDIRTIPSAYRKLFIQPLEEDTRGRSLHVFLDGIDEAEMAEMEELLAQLTPGEDEAQDSNRSRIQLCLVGRSYMSETIATHLDPPTTGHSLTVIQITGDRIARDVKAYIEDGVTHSRILSRSSPDFKKEVIETMEKRVDGLFILAKFMLADMNRKRRASSILKSLESFPREINGMLRKTLVDLSFTITEETADLNEMLRWVTCAEQALTLEQLEAALVLKFGDPPFRFEEILRGQYACFFELEREDGLTTDDLIKNYERLQRTTRRESTPMGRRRRSSSVGESPSPHRNISPAQRLNEVTRRRTSPVALEANPIRRFSPSPSPIWRPDLFDPDQEMEFRSKKSTTIVTFFHTSVREFFRDEDTVHATADSVGPCIGFDTTAARIHVLQTCLRIFNDRHWFKAQNLGRKWHSIKQYAAWYWQEHLASIDPAVAPKEEKHAIGQQVYKMLTDGDTIYDWSIMYEENDEGLEVLTDGNIKAIRTWMADPEVIAGLDGEAKEWAQKLDEQPAGIFQKIGRFYARAWLDETFDKYIPTKFCFKIVQSIAFVDAGYTWSDSQCHWTDIPITERIARATEWAQCERNAHWYRRVGSTYLTAGMHETALENYNEALKRDSDSVEPAGRKAYCLFKDNRYDEALQLALKCEETESKLIAGGRLSESGLVASKWRLYKDHVLVAQCYYRLSEVDRSVEYFHKAMGSAEETKLDYSDRFEAAIGFLEVLAAENRYSDIMKVVHGISLHASSPGKEGSRLVDFLLAQHSNALVMEWLPKAACKADQVDFLIERLEMAIDAAHARRDALKELYLRLALGTTLIHSRKAVDEAIQVFEQISLVEYRPRGNFPTRQAHAVSFQRLASLYKNMVLRAGIRSPEADRWIQRLETVQAKQGAHQNLEMPASMLGSDVNAAAIYLALFYRVRGRTAESEALLSALIVESCEILEDEDLRNDEFALENLLKLFVAAGDEENARALAVSMRKLSPEASISTLGDSPVQQRTHVEPKLPDIQSSNRSCAQCLEIINHSAEFFMCRYCLDSYCRRCLEKVIKPSGKKAPEEGVVLVCRADHEWFGVPPLAKVLHTGELLVDGEVRRFMDWKDGIRKRWEKRGMKTA